MGYESDPVVNGLVAMFNRIREESFQRGFALGLKRMSESPAKPGGKCPHCRKAALVWSAPPQTCGCRSCKCEECGKECVSACFPCEYAGA